MTSMYTHIHEKIEKEQPNICSISISKNNKIILEDFWNGYNENSTVHIMSVTKSIISILIGIAIDQGYIKDANQKVMDFFPEYKVKRGEKTIYDITIKNLLTMTAPYKYKSEPWKKVCISSDWSYAALDLLGGRKGITNEFKYATLGVQILSKIIENSTNSKTLDFANSNLFKPLGITEVRPHNDISEQDQRAFMLSKINENHEWYCDPQGTAVAGWGLSLTANDLVKIGQMLINNGEYDNNRILSKKWIKEMTTPYIDLDEQFGNMSYGYLWWIPDKEKNTFAAIGDGGNIIYINKDLNIVAGITATFKPRVFDRIDYLEKEILPLI